jgi:hypothetical protein
MFYGINKLSAMLTFLKLNQTEFQMKQIELFQSSRLEIGVEAQGIFALRQMLEEVREAYNRYTETAGGNRQYADHITFDGETFTIVHEFWPEMASEYMDQSHPTMWDAIVERDSE